jgi:hypothetical protein
MRHPWIVRAASVAALALAACSSNSDSLLDSAAPLDDAIEDTAAPDAPTIIDAPDAPDVIDVTDVRDVPDVFDAADVRDAPDAPDAPDALDVLDVLDAADVRDVPDVPDAADVRDAPDAADVRDVPAVLDAADVRDVPAVLDAADVRDAPDVPDARDVPIDAAPDAPADNGCGALALCSGACVNTQTSVAHCGACGAACPGVDSECRRRTCIGGVCGSANTASGVALAAQTARDCRRAACDGAGGVAQLPDDGDLPVDGNACTLDVCASGVASNPPTPVGRGCGAGAMLCNGAGACVDCVSGSDCASGVCAAGRCQLASCADGVRNGAETGVDCGGACRVCPALVVLAGGSASVLAGSFDATARVWSTASLAERTVEGVSVAVTRAGEAVGLVRRTALGDVTDNRLRYTVWRAGVWAPFADIGPTVTTQAQPALAASPAGVWAVFHGFDFNQYFAAYDGATWAPPAEATGASGARAAALAADGDNPLMVFSRGLANELYARSRAGGAWGGDQRIEAAAGFDANVSPAAVNLTSTTALAVWSAPGGQLRASLRAGGAWSAPADVPMCISTARVSLARVGDAQAALAFRGTDGNLYAALYASGAWATPARVAVGITGVPAVAPGAPGATAETAFLDGAGRVMHARLVAGAWSAGALVGGTGFVTVALASGP